jgi:signal transduction histidine kinase
MGLRQRVWLGLPPRSIAFDAVVAALGTVAVGITARTPEAAELPDGVLVGGPVILAVLLFLFRRSAPLVPFLASAVLTAASFALSAALPITSYAVGRYVGRWSLRVMAAVVGTVAVIQPWAFGVPNEDIGRSVTAAVVVLLPGVIGAWVRTRAQLVTALTERAERAENERELLARDAVLTERTRIAREMHDVVGHRVSLMVLQAGAIEMAAADPARVEQLAGQVQVAGRQALDELRQMVGVLRAGEGDDATPLGPQPGLADLSRLVAQSRDAGMDVELRALPAGDAVDAAVGRAAFRIVQEALTNAAKHAPGAAVCVTVERPPGELRVRVVSGPGDRVPAESRTGGYGLVGLAERVRTLGGRLSAEPRLDGGFAVEAVLPS